MKNILSPLRRQKKSAPFPAWRSVKECLPEDNTDALVVVGEKIASTRYVRNGHWLYIVDGAVTHWMPLPPPPEEERSKKG